MISCWPRTPCRHPLTLQWCPALLMGSRCGLWRGLPNPPLGSSVHGGVRTGKKMRGERSGQQAAQLASLHPWMNHEQWEQALGEKPTWGVKAWGVMMQGRGAHTGLWSLCTVRLPRPLAVGGRLEKVLSRCSGISDGETSGRNLQELLLWRAGLFHSLWSAARTASRPIPADVSSMRPGAQRREWKEAGSISLPWKGPHILYPIPRLIL